MQVRILPTSHTKTKNKMAKKVKRKKIITITEGEEIILKPTVILKGVIKDGYCQYGYKNQTGTNLGKGSHNGTGLAHPDMLNVFRNFNVHLAVVDDGFATANVAIKNVDNHHDDDLTGHYDVDGFEVTGEDETLCVILHGTKLVRSVHDRISLKTPKIPIHENSSYPWKNELKTIVENAQYEVEQYMLGKHAIEMDADYDPNQTVADFVEAGSNDLEKGEL